MTADRNKARHPSPHATRCVRWKATTTVLPHTRCYYKFMDTVFRSTYYLLNVFLWCFFFVRSLAPSLPLLPFSFGLPNFHTHTRLVVTTVAVHVARQIPHNTSVRNCNTRGYFVYLQCTKTIAAFDKSMRDSECSIFFFFRNTNKTGKQTELLFQIPRFIERFSTERRRDKWTEMVCCGRCARHSEGPLFLVSSKSTMCSTHTMGKRWRAIQPNSRAPVYLLAPNNCEKIVSHSL